MAFASDNTFTGREAQPCSTPAAVAVAKVKLKREELMGQHNTQVNAQENWYFPSHVRTRTASKCSRLVSFLFVLDFSFKFIFLLSTSTAPETVTLLLRRKIGTHKGLNIIHIS